MAFPIIAASLIIPPFLCLCHEMGDRPARVGGACPRRGDGGFFQFPEYCSPNYRERNQAGFRLGIQPRGGGSCRGGLSYLISWLIFGFILKFLFNPDSFLHPLVDGIPGGIQSIVASLIFSFFLFTTVRIVGTLHELNYVASIAKPEISDADFAKLPPPSTIHGLAKSDRECALRLTEWMDHL